jgi:membrane protein YdbS with pleckstrin-like domain
MAAPGERQGPNKKMVHVWAVHAFLIHFTFWIWVAVVIGLVASAGNPGVGLALLGVSVFLGITISYAWAFLYFRTYRWQFADEQMSIWRGILFRHRLTIPYTRVQHAAVVQGPILKLFGLTTVVVETAAQAHHLHGINPHTGAHLPGVRDGERLADAVIEATKRARVAEAA